MAKVYALLVGINDYPDHVGKLQGCLNDIANVEDYLSDHYRDAAVLTLRDSEATYTNVISQFRKHLGQAGKDDVALFHYCGHGARATASLELREFDRDNRDEGLVCFDSREGDKFDLADKELALLLQELAANDPHIAMVLDCCHSGSGTRDVTDAPMAGIRTTTSTYPPRPLASYLDGQLAQMLARGDPMGIPASRHLLMAACDRSQTAKEDVDTHQGFFTTALYDVLRHGGGDLSYADLYIQSRAAVRQLIRDKDKSPQDPQFENFAGFDPYCGFLGRAARKSRPAYSVYHKEGRWLAECGALQGLPTDPAVLVTLALRENADAADPVGTARAVKVGAQTAVIEPDFKAEEDQKYWAEVASMPPPPLLVAFTGDAEVRSALEQALAADPANGTVLVDNRAGDGPVLRVTGNSIQLEASLAGKIIGTAPLNNLADGWAKPMLLLLAHIAQWQRTLSLANPHPRFDSQKVTLRFAEQTQDGTETIHTGPDITLPYRKQGDSWIKPGGKLQIANNTAQVLNYALIYFSEDFGITPLANDQVAPGGEFQTMLVGTDRPSEVMRFTLDEGDDGLERLKVIVTTERLDDFRLAMAPLTATRGIVSDAELADAEKITQDDWLTIDLAFHIQRQLDTVGPGAVSLAEGQLEIMSHPLFAAQVSLASAPEPARATGDYARLIDALTATRLAPATLGGSRGAAVHSIELSDIAHPEALAETPLELKISAPLEDGETLVPLIDDGQHIMLAGDFWQDDGGATHIAINRIPAPAVSSQISVGANVDERSIGGALKMYLFKTYLGIKKVNRLRRANYTPGGSFTYETDDVAGHIARARTILVVVHGIIGDTEALLSGIPRAGLTDVFDCVLSYDYENLATPIGDTARALEADLAAIGLGADHGKQVTLLAHSMGGLVCRQFIERGTGAQVAGHLVMCGTPNRGSPFGRIGSGRKILEVLATIGVNFAPQFCGPALMLLGRSRKLTPTLEQMDPDSDFLRDLNANKPPTTRYTILAGNVEQYEPPAGSSFDALMAKIAQGPAFDALFRKRANDIAVAVDSIVADLPARDRHAQRQNVACHHLNYFTSLAGIAALEQVRWQE